MKITNVTLKLLVLNNKEDYFCPMKMCTFANLDLHVFCWSKLANPYIYKAVKKKRTHARKLFSFMVYIGLIYILNKHK